MSSFKAVFVSSAMLSTTVQLNTTTSLLSSTLTLPDSAANEAIGEPLVAEYQVYRGVLAVCLPRDGAWGEQKI